MMRITDLPDDCLLACLARRPYADLRNGVPSTCKQLRDAVASSAFRKLREASGWVEWGVFATARGASADACFLITESGVRRTAPRPPYQSGYYVERPQNEVIVISGLEPMRARAYNPSENTWRDIAPLVRDLDGRNYDSLDYHASLGCIGGHLVVIGGGDEETLEAFQRRMDAYDPAQDAWSRLPDVPFTSHMNGLVEVDGKLYCFGGYQWHPGAASQHEDARRTFVYDPATRTWTDGPRLPHEPRVNEYGLKCISAFERSKRLCIMGSFSLNDGSFSLFLAFVWDPTRETWDKFPAPPVAPEYRGVSQVDGHVVVYGYGGVSDPGEHIFVLRSGSRDWTEWAIPAAVDNAVPLPHFHAVRIG